MRIVFLAMLAALGASPVLAASIAPHRAIYDLSLLRVSQGASLSSVEGRLAFEIQGSRCEGWTTSFRMANRFGPAEGDVKTVDTQSTSFESGDFLDLRYNQKEFINGGQQSETRIKVSRDAPGAEGMGEQGADGSAPFAVPGDAVFPMQHQLKLMDMAAAGQSRDSSLIYDGSDGPKLFRAITFIGKRKEAGTNQRDVSNPEAAILSALPAWPVSISYYPVTGGDGDTPEYQVSFDLYENGVATGLVLDYGEFALSGNLRKLETLGGEPCN